MKNLNALILLGLMSSTAFASSTYRCQDMLGKQAVEVRIKTKKITIQDGDYQTVLKTKNVSAAEQTLLDALSTEELDRFKPEDLNYLQSYQYQVITRSELISYTDYFYLSNSLLEGADKGALMINDRFSYGPIPNALSWRNFYRCNKK